MKKKRRRAARAFTRASGLPADMLPSASAVTLTSDCEALVTGCRRVREYGRGRVVMSLCDCELTVEGEDLTMKTFFGNQILICGRITGVNYE